MARRIAMLAAAAAQGARGLRQMQQTGRWPVPGGSVSMRLGLGLNVAPGEAVSAGPVWQGGGYWESDGTAYLTGPTVTLDAAKTLAILVRMSRPTAVGGHYLVTARYSGNERVALELTGAAAFGQTNRTAGYHYGSGGGALTGAHDIYGVHRVVSGYGRAAVAVDASSLYTDGAGSTSTLSPFDSSTPLEIFVGLAKWGAGQAAAVAGEKIFDVTVGLREFTSGELTTLAASQVNPLTVVTDAYEVWDMRNAVEVAGVMKVPGIVTGASLTQTNGTSARFGTGAFA